MAEIRTNASGEGEGFNGGYFETRFAFSEDRERLWSVLVRYLQKRYIPSDAVVLDIGAGYCHFINNVEAHVCSCTMMTDLADSYFDVVFASNLFEHLERGAFWQTLKQVRRVLKSRGKLIVIQPNFRLCYKNYFDDYTHVQVFTDTSLVDALESVGFQVNTLVPAVFGQIKVAQESLPIEALLTSPLQAVCRANAGRGGEQEVGDSLSQEEDRYVGRKESLGHFPCL